VDQCDRWWGHQVDRGDGQLTGSGQLDPLGGEAGMVVDPVVQELPGADAGADGDRMLEASIRFARQGTEIPRVRAASWPGTIATYRYARGMSSRSGDGPMS